MLNPSNLQKCRGHPETESKPNMGNIMGWYGNTVIYHITYPVVNRLHNIEGITSYDNNKYLIILYYII